MGSQKKKESVDVLPSEQSAAERLAEIDAQRKVLVERLKQEKRDAIQSRKEAKFLRNVFVRQQDATVGQIQESIYAYNRLSKQKKAESGIFALITTIIAESAAKPQTMSE